MLCHRKAVLLLLTLLFAIPLRASAQSYDRLIVFGDSLSDTGNHFAIDGTPGFPYYQGHYSNGPVWVEYLAAKLGITYSQADNYAVGSATTGTFDADGPQFPGMATQLGAYLGANPVADPNALYIVWGGANDFAAGAVFAPSVPVNNIAEEVMALAQHGAKHILVPNLPDLGSLPATAGLSPQEQAFINQQTGIFNDGLEETLDILRKDLPVDDLWLMDVNTLFHNVAADPAAYGFTNTTDAYLADLTGNPNSYLFWDGEHPTTAAHALLGDLAFATVPEPGSVALLVGLGASASVLVLRRRARPSA